MYYHWQGMPYFSAYASPLLNMHSECCWQKDSTDAHSSHPFYQQAIACSQEDINA